MSRKRTESIVFKNLIENIKEAMARSYSLACQGIYARVQEKIQLPVVFLSSIILI